MKKFFAFIFLLLTLAAGAAFWGYQQLQQFANQTLNSKPEQLLTLERGTTGNKLVALLEREKLLDNAALLPWQKKKRPEKSNVKAGTYSLNGVNTVADLLKALNEGKEGNSVCVSPKAKLLNRC